MKKVVCKIGEKIAEKRKKENISIRELAKKMGVSVGVIHNWEHGKTEPRFSHIKKLEEILDMGVLSISSSEEQATVKK